MKIAFIFPGIGYTHDKPLLYYAQALVKEKYEIVRVSYGDLKRTEYSLNEMFELAYSRVLEEYKDFDISKYDTVLCISKSIGTAISTRLDHQLEWHARHILYTPIELTFDYAQSGIAFSGTLDSWVKNEIVVKGCKEKNIPLFLFEDCNHSLECGNVQKNIHIIDEVMKYTLKFLETL